MKLKKVLCLPVVAVLTFTSSMSLWASAEIGGTPHETSQSFGSAILDELFTPSSNNSDVTNPDNGGISPLWSKDDHKEIVDFNINDLPEYHIRILRGTSNWADDCFPASDNNKDSFVTAIPALHGAGNYVINLEFLWYFSVFLGRESDPSNTTEMNNAIKSARSNAINKIKNTTAYAKRNENHLQNLIDNSGTLVKYDANIKKNNPTRTAAEMKMRILGYASHLVGDVYAHRTVLPSLSKLNMSYFIRKDLEADFSNGFVEFRYLAKEASANGYLISNTYKTIVNNSYVDSTTFYPNRYTDATASVSLMLTHKQGGFDYYLFLCPCSNDVKLSNFKKFVTQAGLNTSELTSSEWSKYST